MGAATSGFAVNNISLSEDRAARDASTLSGQSASLHDELGELEQTVILLEGDLGPVLKQWPQSDGNEGEALEALPPAVDSVRQAGFRVVALRRRLYELRQRLALQ